MLYRNCIELESNLACAGNIDGLVNARKLYDSALTTYDQDVNLWRNYYLMEVKVSHVTPLKSLKINIVNSLVDALIPYGTVGDMLSSS